MFTGYNLPIRDVIALIGWKNKDKYCSIAIEHYRTIKQALQQRMKSYVLQAYDEDTDSILMTSIEKDFFPNVKSHIFLSHSSCDKETALSLAGYLWENCRVEVFIDSMLWKYCDDLLKILDDKYARTGNHSYDYDNRNITTAQVHVLLDMALARMINDTECFWFLESGNSVNCVSKRITSSETESPWIYSELLLSEIIQKRLPLEHRCKHFNESFSHGDSAVPSFIYNARLSQLHELSKKDISFAISQVSYDCVNENLKKRPERFLDCLYETTEVNLDE